MRFALLLLLPTLVTLADDRPTYFDHQRRGANYFNETPTEQWFKDAAAAHIEWARLAFTKWKGADGEFLLGKNADFRSLVPADLALLKTTLDHAHHHNIKVVLTPLSLPGGRWKQVNNNKFDKRLYTDLKYHAQSADFWRQLAAALKDHPAVVGYDILNEPAPERAMGLDDEFTADLAAFNAKHQGTAADLNLLNQTIHAAIRSVDPHTPIILESGFFAFPGALPFLKPLDDHNVLYSIHAYAPWSLTNWKQNAGRYAYPGDLPAGDKTLRWDAAAIAAQFDQVSTWAAKYHIPPSRIMVGEFGCDRRVKGVAQLLADTIAQCNAHHYHWAFYAFREDGWDAMDYELGDQPLGWKYWQAVEAGKDPESQKPRHDNPIWQTIHDALK